jgi:phage-related protein
MREDLLNFVVLFYSKDGVTSPILDYLQELSIKNEDLASKAIQSIVDLPLKFYNFDDIKIIKTGKINFYELRVKVGTNICRFFFLIEKPNYVIFYGFTKKTQKTDSKDLKQGQKNLIDLNENQTAISVTNLTLKTFLNKSK